MNNICCIRMERSIAAGVVVIVNAAYYISEPKNNSYWDTALWNIHYCPFCGEKIESEE